MEVPTPPDFLSVLNTPLLPSGLSLIRLTNGKSALIDQKWFEILSQKNWYFTPFGYAIRSERKPPHKRYFWMHRVVMNAPVGILVDHINRNKLDNRTINLRLCTHSQNKMNVSKYVERSSHFTSRFKGVSLITINGKWKSEIKVHGHSKHLGCFHTEEEAAKAYDIAAIALVGDFAGTNFPITDYSPQQITEWKWSRTYG
jgi:hypothetical protein